MSLKLPEEWTIGEFADTKVAEYQTGIGSILFLLLSRNKDKDRRTKVTPYEKTTENLQITKSDFSLAAEAAEELYPQIGKFTLALPAFDLHVEIDTSKGIEEIIEKAIIEALKNGEIYLF